MDEKEAILQLKRGDVRGLEVLVRKYQLEAVRIVYPIVNDQGLAEEIVQEVFLRIYQRIDQYDENRSFRSWFLRIVINDALKAIQQQNRLVSLDDPLDETAEERETAAYGCDENLRFEQAEFSADYADAEAMKELLNQLTPEHRAVLELKYYLEMTDSEIADALQVAPGTVKSRLHAAKAKFRSLLQRFNFLFFIG